jgi:flagellar FliL protein
MSDKETASNTKTKWLPIVLVAAMCSGTVGGAVYWLGQKQLEQALATVDKSGANTKKPAVPVVIETPIYLKIAPFTVNIKSDDPRARARLLYSGVTFKLGNKETEKFLSEHMVEIRSRLLMLVADSKAEVLVTPEGKAALTNQIMDMLKLPFSDPQPEIVVNEVLFTDFIVQ